MTLTKINRDKAGTDTALNAALSNGVYLGNVTIKTVGASSDITISNTRVSTDKAGAFYISNNANTLTIESGRDIIVTDTGDLSTAGSMTLRAGRDIEFKSSPTQKAKLNFNGAATARFTAGDAGGIKIGTNVEFTATNTDAVDFVLNAGYIDANGVFAARKISGDVKALTNAATATHATVYFKKLKGIGGSVNVTITDFVVVRGNLKVEGMDGSGLLNIGAEVTIPAQPDLTTGLQVNGAAAGGLGAVDEFDIDIKTDLATLKVNGLLKGSKAKLTASSIVSDNGGLQVVNALTMFGTSTLGQISLSRIDSSKTKIKSVTAANNMSLTYDSAVTLDGLSVVMQNTPANRIMKITTNTGTIDFGANGLTLNGGVG
ncbi:MAG: hypothetical protein ORO03_09455, partial [Alphaproteobacteria bacterium]|nr:hypothetical protein [Alphaproteobacteria bacterium]